MLLSKVQIALNYSTRLGLRQRMLSCPVHDDFVKQRSRRILQSKASIGSVRQLLDDMHQNYTPNQKNMRNSNQAQEKMRLLEIQR